MGHEIFNIFSGFLLFGLRGIVTINLGKSKGHKNGHNFFLSSNSILVYHVVHPNTQLRRMVRVTWVGHVGGHVGGPLPKKFQKPKAFWFYTGIG